MDVDSDKAYVLTLLLESASFILAASATAYRRRFGYTGFYVLAAIETHVRVRYSVVAFGRSILVGDHPSTQAKYAVQSMLLAGAGTIGALLIVALIFRLRRAPTELVLAMGTLGVATMFTLETISYHFLDAVIYQVEAGVGRSGWFFAASALIATIGALMLPKARSRQD